MKLPFDLAIPLLGLYPINPEPPLQKTLCTPMFIAVQFIKCWKQPKCPSVNEWIKKLVHLHDGILTAEKKEERLPFMTAGMELESIMLVK